MAIIGTSKTLRNGTTIEFTRANPTKTFNAIHRYLNSKDFELDEINRARTGSLYLSMYNGRFEITVRCANHTQGYEGRSIKLHLDSLDNGIISIELDLSRSDMVFNDFKNLFDEIYDLNAKRTFKGTISVWKENKTFDVPAGVSEIIKKGIESDLKEWYN